MKTKTLFKSVVNEEHEAVQVQVSGYRPEKPATISLSSSRASFRFDKMPTEITVNVDSDGEMGSYFKISEIIRPKLKELHAKNPEEAERIRALIPDLLSQSDAKQLEAELQEEFGELLDHLTVMLKAKVVQFLHEHKAVTEKYNDKIARELLRQINDALAK